MLNQFWPKRACPAAARKLALLLAVALMLACGSGLNAQDKDYLRLIQTISLPHVKGRMDHMDVDVEGRRLFVSALDNGSVEVVDLKASRWLQSIPALKKPQGVAYLSSLNKLFVASGDDGTLRVFHGDTLQLLASIKLDLGPNRLAYDREANLLYVGYGGKDAGKAYGEVGIIEVTTNKHIGDIQVAAHPAEMLLDRSGHSLFVLVPSAGTVQVVNTSKREVISTTTLSSQRPGDAAFDESTHRLFIGTHTPPRMIVLDSDTGKEVAGLSTVDGMDGVYFDAAHKRIYVSGGRGLEAGSVFVYQQKDPDHYETLGEIPTRPGAGTSFWSPELDCYYVAAPAQDNRPAEILVFQPNL